MDLGLGTFSMLFGKATSRGLLLFSFVERGFLYSSSCPGTCSVDQAGLELRDLPASAQGGTFLSFHHMGPRDQTQNVNFGSRHLYLLNYLSRPRKI